MPGENHKNLPEENPPNSESRIDEYGQIVQEEEKLEKKDENPIFRLLNLREIVLIQSIHPNYVKQPADALYWRPGRLEQNKKIFKDLFNLLEKSIAYSEDINRQLITEPSEQAEGNTDQKAALRKKLLEK